MPPRPLLVDLRLAVASNVVSMGEAWLTGVRSYLAVPRLPIGASSDYRE